MSNGQKSPVGIIILGVVLVVCLVFGYKVYNGHQKKVRYEACQRREAERIAAEKAEAERVAAEKARAEAQERRKIELERQREEEERKRIERERKAAEEAAERQRKINEMKADAAAYQAAIISFKNREYGFVEQAPAEAKVSTAAEGIVFWCAMSDFGQTKDKELFKLTADGKGGFAAQRFARSASPVEMNSAEVKRLIDSGGCAMVVSNKVWVTIPGGRIGKCPVPEAGKKLVPSKVDLQEMSEAMDRLGCKPPDVRCKVILRSNDGKFTQEVGIYPYAAEIDLSKMRSTVRNALGNDAKKKGEDARGAEKPRKSVRRRKYRKTVMLYDGQIIRREMKGITYVPREFHYTGSNRYGTNNDKYYAAKRAWRNLYDEALRQEKLEQEVLAGNAETTSSPGNNAERAYSVSYDDVEDFLAKCNLQVLLARPKDK